MAGRRSVQRLISAAVFSLLIASAALAAPGTQTVSSGTFLITFPRTLPQIDVEKAAGALASARKKLASVFGAPDNARTQVFLYASTGDFCAATKHPAWHGAVWLNGALHLQPPSTLEKRRALLTTVIHELVHASIGRRAPGKLPAWFEEGFAAWVSGEFDDEFKVNPGNFRWNGSAKDLDAALNGKSSKEKSAKAYRAAFAVVKFIAAKHGRKTPVKIIETAAAGKDFDTALKAETGMTVKKLFEEFGKSGKTTNEKNKRKSVK